MRFVIPSSKEKALWWTKARRIAIGLVGLTLCLPLVSGQDGGEACVALFGTGMARSETANTAGGRAEFTVDGKHHTATLDLTFAFAAPGPDGSSSVTSAHVFSVRNAWGRRIGSFTTSDTGSLTPTNTEGLLKLDLNLEIVSGTGAFRNAGGAIMDRGLLSVANAEASSVSALAGSVCLLASEKRKLGL
jgi:hypothetical protein